jgi:glycosyltransferase involved in cell wall biosynthesis
VLIPVFNEHGRLAGTLDSLAAQSVPLVVVLVDDGSTVPLSVDTARYAFELVVLRHAANQGIERALNTGLRYIRRRRIPYVARLDNGDRCVPGRLVRQRDFLERHPDVQLVGCAVEWRDDAGRVRFTRVLPTAHEDIVRALHHTNALIHPAVMFRTRVVDSVGMYTTSYPAAEDYEFFLRVARRHRVANLSETLLVARFDPRGVSMRRRREQLRSTLRLQLSYFEPATWTSWYGLLKTVARFLVPYSWIVSLKALQGGRAPAVAT